MLLLYSFLITFLGTFFFPINLEFHLLIQSLISIALYLTFLIVLRIFFDLEPLAGNDILFKFDREGNRTHVEGVLTFEKRVDTKLFLNMVKSRWFSFPKKFAKLKKNIWSILGLYFWTTDHTFSIENHIEIISEPMANYGNLYDFIAKHISEVEFAEKHPSWKLYLVEKFNNQQQSAIIFKAHHSYGDGISFLAYLIHLFDVQEVELIKLPKLKAWHHLLAAIIAPIKGTIIFLKYLLMRKDKNFFRGDEHVTGKKQICCTEPLDLDKYKLISKRNSITINDLLTAAICKTLKDLGKERFNEELKHFKIALPISLRPLPEKGQIYELTNAISIMFIDMPVSEQHTNKDFLQFYGKYLKQLKLSLDILIVKYVVDFIALLFPAFLVKPLVSFIADKPSCIFSNVPGPKNTFTCLENKMDRLFCIVNTYSDISLSLVIFSFGNKIILTVMTDEAISVKAKEIADRFTVVMEKEFSAEQN